MLWIKKKEVVDKKLRPLKFMQIFKPNICKTEEKVVE